MAGVVSSDNRDFSIGFDGEPDNDVALNAHFQDLFGRVPDPLELKRLAHCRESLSWRIAPPRRLHQNSRVIARRSQPGVGGNGQAPGAA